MVSVIFLCLQIKLLCNVVIPMREMSSVEKVTKSDVLPNAIHITTRSKVLLSLVKSLCLTK